MNKNVLTPDPAEFAEKLAVASAQLGLTFDARQQHALLDYLGLLRKWNAAYNLTAVRDAQQMLTQHLLDCMAALPAFAGARRGIQVKLPHQLTLALDAIKLHRLMPDRCLIASNLAALSPMKRVEGGKSVHDPVVKS